MRFRLLGPLEVQRYDGESVPLRAAKQRTVLAILLLHSNRRVSVDRLTASLWQGQPPRSAAGNVRTYVSALRQILEPDGQDRPVQLHFERGGYQLDLAPSELDLLVFEDFEQRGRRALGNGDSAEAARLLWEALRLWRGQPVEDVTLGSDEAATLAGLEERHLLAEEAWVDAQLAQGKNEQLIVRLRSLVAGQPLREQLWHRLMVALYLSGRSAEALAAFHELRRRVVDELGIEPGPQAQRLQRQILAGEPLDFQTATTTLAAVHPRQLPPDIADFTGRTRDLDRLTTGLAAWQSDQRAAAILTISGTAGAGKTALAVHWAHQVADQFGDGQLYVNLRGYAPIRPLAAQEVLARFLRALGMSPDQIPGELDEAAAMYRSLLAGKRMLILLDNAAAAEQVRPLRPGTPHSLVLVTSRSRMPGLTARDGAVQVALDPLTAADAILLLRNLLGRGRVDAEPEAAAEIAARCGFLPLSLRIAADHIANRTYLTLAELAIQLGGTSDRLDILAASDDAATTVRTVFSWSYLALAADAARMFRLVGLHAGPDISAAAAACLAGTTEQRARQLLDALAGVHLLEKTAPMRYRFHDLLGAYAADCAHADESADNRASALWRLLTWCLHAAVTATRILAPAQRVIAVGPAPPHCAPRPLPGYSEALRWYGEEYGSLVAAVRLAAENNHDDIAWKLAATMQYYFDLRKSWTDWISTHEIGLMCARRSGDRCGEAWMLNDLGGVYFDLRRHEEALACISKALELRRAVGDRPGQVLCLNNLGIIYRERDQFDRAIGSGRQALALSRETGDRRGEAAALHGLGEIHRKRGRPEESLRRFEHSLALFRSVNERRGECFALHSIGETYHDLRRSGEGVPYVRQALAIRRQAGDRQGEGEALRTLGDLFADTDQPEAARQSWHQALAILDDLGDPKADAIRERLARG